MMMIAMLPYLLLQWFGIVILMVHWNYKRVCCSFDSSVLSSQWELIKLNYSLRFLLSACQCCYIRAIFKTIFGEHYLCDCHIIRIVLLRLILLWLVFIITCVMFKLVRSHEKTLYSHKSITITNHSHYFSRKWESTTSKKIPNNTFYWNVYQQHK